MKKYIPYIIITILLVIIASGTTYIFMDKKDNKPEIKENNNKENNNEKDNNQNEESEKITLTSKEIEEYLSYVPFLDATLPYDNESEQYADAYSGNKNTIDTINKEILLYKAYQKSEEINFSSEEQIPELKNLKICNFEPCKLESYYEENIINKNLLKMYNKTPLNIKELSIPGGALYYEKPYYAAHFGAGSSTYNKINKTVKGEKTTDYIIIEEEVLFTRFADYDKDVEQIVNKIPIKIYKNTYDMKNNIKNLNKNIIYLDSNKINEDIIKPHSIDLSNYEFSKYKHTFKKGTNSYYWYSSEILN